MGRSAASAKWYAGLVHDVRVLAAASGLGNLVLEYKYARF